MLSVIAIVVAGFSLTCIVITVYRNLPSEPVIVLKSDHGTNGPAPAPPPAPSLELAIDPEINVLL
jgi:hypothetical protein